MKKRFKGFTLVECLVALAVLGMASLTMAQIYSNVARKNKTNNLINTSLSNQMAYVERYTDSETITVAYGGAASTDPPHKTDAGGSTNYVKIQKVLPTDTSEENKYSFPVDVYLLRSRNSKDEALNKQKSDMISGAAGHVGPDSEYVYYDVVDVGNTNGYGEADYNLRYKYILGHS